MSDPNSLVNQTVRSAVERRSPMEVDLANGAWLVVHPQAEFVLVSVGKKEGVDAIELLHRRWRHPERFGQWMPAAMNDDNPIAVMRLPRQANGDVALFDDADLAYATEFLS